MTIPKSIAYSLATETTGLISPAQTTVGVVAVSGHFPSLSGGEFTYAVLSSDKEFADQEADYETVKVTAINSLTLTIVRNIESTGGAKEWPAGTAIFCPVTAVGWTDMITQMLLRPLLGETANDAYRGDRGKIAYDHSQDETGGVHGAVSGITNNMIIRRDSAGRAKVAAPAASDDIARKNEVDGVQTNLTSHENASAVHDATNLATANRILLRDANGRAQVAAPATNEDIARLYELNLLDSYITSHAGLSAAHNATHLATASRILLRDTNGRARVAAPSLNTEIALLSTVKDYAIIKQALTGSTVRNTTTSTTYQNSSLSQAFAAERSNSALIIVCKVGCGVYANSSTDFRLGALRLINATSNIIIGSAAECRWGNILHVASANAAYRLATITMFGLYQPGTTASRTYRMQFRSLHANTTVEIREDYFNPWMWIREVAW